MDILSDRPEKLTVAELTALKLELSKVRQGTKKVRAWLAVLGIPEEELPTRINIKRTYNTIDRELIHRCPFIDTCVKAKRAAEANTCSRNKQ